jgi:hypothetical protein
MTLSNWSHLLGFFSPRKVNLKTPINSGLGQPEIACSRKMTLGRWFHQILFPDLARWLSSITKSRKMTSLGLADSSLSQAGIRQDPVSHLPWFGVAGRWLTGAWPIPACRKPESAKPWQVIFRDLVTPEDDLPGPAQFQLRSSQNCWNHLIGFAKFYKMTFRRQKKYRKVTLVGQSHLRNP